MSPWDPPGGITQKPIEGVSTAYSVDKPGGARPQILGVEVSRFFWS
jgi:hypothetical protein